MRKLLTILVCLILGFNSITVVAKAEEDYAGNFDYYNDLCTSGKPLSDSDKQVCSGFLQYLSNSSEDLRGQLDEIESQREEIAQNIQIYVQKIATYDSEIAALGAEIAELNNEILVIEAQITEKEEEIETKQNEIDEAEEKIKDRMVASQSSMRLNQYIDILMGAKDFNDLLRRANGIRVIAEYDEKTMEEINVMIQELNVMVEELEEQKVVLDEAKAELVEKQDKIYVLRAEAAVVAEEYRKQEAELEALGNKIATDIEAINEQMKTISEELNQIVPTAGWTRPTGGGISAGTWHYPSGGVHLGVDYASPSGTLISAAGNGVVIKSSDGCPAGYLGNTCGGSGSYMGGNQVYLLTKVNGGLYAVKYLHMLAGSPIKQGSIVNAGEVIGKVGQSGNASGPHVHVEVFYLGTGTISSYATSWNGDLAFGCGWSSAALGRLCENGVGAPCRMKPENLFG